MFQFIFRVLNAVQTRYWQARGRFDFWLIGVHAGPGLKMYGLPTVSMVPGSMIELGANVVLCSHSKYTALGVARPVVLRTLRPGAYIKIGADVGISGGVICAASSVEIGNSCLFGADVQIVDTDFHPIAAANRRRENRPEYIATAPVVIGENVFLGAGVRVLKGVRIGANSVIGAGSLVVHDIPENVVAAGIPARVISGLPEVVGAKSVGVESGMQI